MSYLIGLAGIVFVFGLVIFVHEFGHFIVAKKTGVKVERFSFGLGPEMAGFQWGETRYCLAWIPLGGEVRMAGEMEDMEGTVPPDPRSFFGKPWYRRIPIVLAGPAMNYVLALIVFWALALAVGEARPDPAPVVGDVVAGFPAQEAGLRAGDRFTAVNGSPVGTWAAMAEVIHRHPGKVLKISYTRDGESQTATLTSRKDPSSGRGLIGVGPATLYVPQSAGAAFKTSLGAIARIHVQTVAYFREKFIRRERPEVNGPLGIAALAGKAAQAGWLSVMTLMAFVSVGIGMMNLLPIPLLDGGHLVYFLIEGLRGRPLRRGIQQTVNALGLSFLLVILVFGTFNDIRLIRLLRGKTPAENTGTGEK
jgi:regulator of sigma E protease